MLSKPRSSNIPICTLRYILVGPIRSDIKAVNVLDRGRHHTNDCGDLPRAPSPRKTHTPHCPSPEHRLLTVLDTGLFCHIDCFVRVKIIPYDLCSQLGLVKSYPKRSCLPLPLLSVSLLGLASSLRLNATTFMDMIRKHHGFTSQSLSGSGGRVEIPMFIILCHYQT